MCIGAGATKQPTVLVLDEYQVPLGDDGSWLWGKLSVSLAGIGGTLAVLGVALLLGRGFQPNPPQAEAGHAT